ncbi:hypothetical protein Tco_0724963 [Tanacetum coccineum]|uniref:MAK10-like protein n=1 Tax=Tanacetum coccineum TaxID=301880 RepID=A0ABQ4YD49_9ASTR
MPSLAENVIATGTENRPPMLEKGCYDIWQSRMLLYIVEKEHGEMLLDSMFLGPFEFKEITIPANAKTGRKAKHEYQEPRGGSLSNLKIPCNIEHVHVGKAYIYLNSPINITTRMQYNWIMRKQLEPREDPDSLRGISNFTGRVRRMHIFVGNFTYVSDFVIVEDISSAIDPRLSQVILGTPFVEISNMTHDLSLEIVKFTNVAKEIAYKMSYKIEQFNLLSDLEKKHTQSVYFRNDEDKKRGVDYVMNKVIFDKEKPKSS